jgi:hypothetical protein
MSFFDFTDGKPYPIVSPGKRKFYLISFGGLCELDLPPDIEAFQKQRALLDALKIRAAIGWMVKVGEGEAAAIEWMRDIPEGWQIYLSSEDRMQCEDADRRIEALNLNYRSAIATLMMQNRLAFHVEIATDSVDLSTLKIVEPWFTAESLISVGDEFRSINGQIFVVRENYNNDGLLHCHGNGQRIRKGDPLFLVEDGEFVCGSTSWSEADTKKLTRQSGGDTQIAQLMRFFELEQSARKEADETETPVPLAIEPNDLPNMATPPSPTGTEFIGDSNSLDAETQDLPIEADLPVPQSA